MRHPRLLCDEPRQKLIWRIARMPTLEATLSQGRPPAGTGQGALSCLSLGIITPQSPSPPPRPGDSQGVSCTKSLRSFIPRRGSGYQCHKSQDSDWEATTELVWLGQGHANRGTEPVAVASSVFIPGLSGPAAA